MDDAAPQSVLESARRGNRRAQAQLLRQLQDCWFRFCLGMLGDCDQARDATQETALRFLRNLPSFRGDSELRTWSLGIALNVAREMRRATHRAAIASGHLASGDPPAVSPDALASETEQHALIRATLARLPDRQREAIVLRYFEDLSLDRTAAAMNCAVGTVKATLHQALRSMRSKLKQPT